MVIIIMFAENQTHGEGPSESNAAKPVIVELENKTISAGDLEALDPKTTHLALRNCISVEWGKIGEQICRFSNLKSLEMIGCNSRDALIAPLVNCQQLMELTMGK